MPTVRTNGIETYYESHGEGRPVVFIHGATSDQQLWGYQVEALRDSYRVVTYDVRDHGKSGSSPTEYTIDVLADDLHDLIEALELDAPVVCGLSLGGFIAQRHAVDYPGEAAGYVFADTFLPRTFSIEERVLQSVVGGLHETVIRIFGDSRARDAFERVMTTVFGPDEEHTPDEDRLDRLRDGPAEPTHDEEIRITNAARSWRDHSIDLSEISVPVLALYGEHEMDLIRAHVGQMCADIPDFRAHELPDAGHNAHVDAPEAFTRRLREFLETIESSDRSAGDPQVGPEPSGST